MIMNEAFLASHSSAAIALLSKAKIKAKSCLIRPEYYSANTIIFTILTLSA